MIHEDVEVPDQGVAVWICWFIGMVRDMPMVKCHKDSPVIRRGHERCGWYTVDPAGGDINAGTESDWNQASISAS